MLQNNYLNQLSNFLEICVAVDFDYAWMNEWMNMSLSSVSPSNDGIRDVSENCLFHRAPPKLVRITRQLREDQAKVYTVKTSREKKIVYGGKRWVFSCDRKVVRVCTERSDSGREFQTDDKANEKERRPVSELTLGIFRRFNVAERRLLDGVWTWRRSWRYEGCLFCRVLKVSVAILKVMRCLIGNQCSLVSAGVIWSDRLI